MEGYDEQKWLDFEMTGRIADYLEYKGVLMLKPFGDGESTNGNADGEGSRSSGNTRRRK